jgi:hypothetical protein
MKGFLRGITLTKKPEEKMEILVVGHVTFLKKLVIGFDGDRTGMCFLGNLCSHRTFISSELC